MGVNMWMSGRPRSNECEAHAGVVTAARPASPSQHPTCMASCPTESVDAPLQVLLLDEVTVDLDVLARSSLMAFLRKECEERGATVVYVSCGEGVGTMHARRGISQHLVRELLCGSGTTSVRCDPRSCSWC